MGDRRYTAGQVAALAGTTVRPLHHYDRIGLLVPAGRTAAGYRVYGPGDLARLREILLLRQLGVPLAELWNADDRFRRNIDRHGEGLTDWLVEVAGVRQAR